MQYIGRKQTLTKRSAMQHVCGARSTKVSRLLHGVAMAASEGQPVSGS
jgi:hypothetical protein